MKQIEYTGKHATYICTNYSKCTRTVLRPLAILYTQDYMKQIEYTGKHATYICTNRSNCYMYGVETIGYPVDIRLGETNRIH